MADPWQNHAFLAETAAAHRWHYQQTAPRTFLLQGTTPAGLSWTCTAEQDLTADPGPTSSFTWLCPALAITEARIQQALKSPAPPFPLLTIRPNTPQTEIGTLLALLRNLFSGKDTPAGLRIEDPANILDPSLITRLQHWPDAFTASGHLRPPTLGFVRIDTTGLHLRSAGWWASAPALAHQIHLGIDLAARLLPHFAGT
ncbi:MAG: hypothetical protein JNK87_40545 [Bryobacterales bacterium]|nr:hypothetical protein [Bryobacterales bacterium]